MRSKARSLLQWVLFVAIVFSPIYGLRGSASQLLTVPPPNFEASPPNTQAEIPSVPPSSTPEASKEYESSITRKREPIGGLQQKAPVRNAPSTLLPAPGSVASPASITSPVSHEPNGIPVAAPPRELPDHVYPVNHSKEFSPAMIPTPPEVKNTSNTAKVSPVSPSHQLGSSPVMSPVPHEGKQPLNITDAPLSSKPGFFGSSPVTSPVPHNKQPPSSAHAPQASHLQPSGSPPVIDPIPHEGNKTSNITHSPAPSSLHPSESPPRISPTPHEVKEPSNITHSPPSHPLPSGSSPVMSPAPPQVKEPSNITNSPLPSHPLPSEFPPMTSHTPPQVKESPNATHSPLPSEFSPMTSPTPPQVKDHQNATHSPLPSESSPMTSRIPPQVKDPPNATHSPLPLESSPVTSRTTPQVKEPANATQPPLPSHPLPLESSPATRPMPPKVKQPPNTSHSPRPSHLKANATHSPRPSHLKANATHSPLPSHSVISESSPATSPTPPEVKQSPNTSHSSLPSHMHPSKFSPAISPAPHEVIDPSNNTHSSFASNPKLSRSSPMTSPTAHGVEEPSNITHSRLPSDPHPLISSPMISPAPPKVKDHPSISYPPLASDPKHSAMPPMISPTTHEVKDPSNTTHSPLPSYPPSELSPTPSPPNEAKGPSNITHAPSTSHPNLSGSSPAMSPTPHEVKEPPNVTVSPLHSPITSPPPHELKDPSDVTHSPFPSPPRSSEHSPTVSPVPHGVKRRSSATNAPMASPPHPSPYSPLLSPMPHEVKNTSNVTHAPLPLPPHPSEGIQTPAFAPLAPPPTSSRHAGSMISPLPSHIPAASPSNEGRKHAPSPLIRGPSSSPVQAPLHVVPKNSQRNRSPSLSPIQAPFPSASREVTHSPSPSSVIPSQHNTWPIHPPVLSPGFSRKPRAPPPKPVWVFPPPPPNLDCKSLSCQEPHVYPPPGSVCTCVLPINVGLRLSVSLYMFFPLISELAQEIASGIFAKQSQVRIMGANSTTEDAEKTSVFIDLVPFGRSFDMNTALLIFERFWHKQVLIKPSYFGDYDVLYVRYPGLPPSPPMAPGDVDGGLENGGNARTMKPLGVDVGKRKEKLSGGLIAIVVLASVIALVISIGATCLLLLKCRNHFSQPPPTQQAPPPSGKPSGTGQSNLGSGPGSASASFTSSIAAGSAKTFSLAEMERATHRFHESKVIGEGGFGRVYQGTLEDGTMVAVKVLKRHDHQGGREFLAEVEMLSRLHHRNLVKLIGICTEENVHCLVYELIPNGSVESHLHGLDKETSPLDWNARMKIALGAARGLAYLHEDSSPRVIHRDFKSSNILLEHDFTPKVSDFGLARTALDEGNEYISTRVMGTFGYVAPEYAMTGHLLVKSDVYSYGVVLLELLTGRKPVDMSQPPGQENLVSWARPLLTSMDGLEKMIDPALGASISLDCVAKVAAIASMCVQPEVSHRPSMGEVVQALKLVCNESEEHRRLCSQDESSTKDSGIRISTGLEDERVVSESDIFCTSAAFAKDASSSFRRYSSSGPMRTDRSQKFWEKVRGFSSGSMEHGIARRPRSGLDGGEHWP